MSVSVSVSECECECGVFYVQSFALLCYLHGNLVFVRVHGRKMTHYANRRPCVATVTEPANEKEAARAKNSPV